MNATLSILGLYNYDPHILDGLQVPDGLDRQTLIEYIFMECADLELLFPDAEVLKPLIESWAQARAHSWEWLYESTVQKYNMIHNFDRYEDWTDTGSGTAKGTSKQSKAAYNASALVDTDSTETDGSSTSRATHSGHLYGNIGITTAGQMITETRELYKYDVYNAIANEFKMRFCILVY